MPVVTIFFSLGTPPFKTNHESKGNQNVSILDNLTMYIY